MIVRLRISKQRLQGVNKCYFVTLKYGREDIGDTPSGGVNGEDTSGGVNGEDTNGGIIGDSGRCGDTVISKRRSARESLGDADGEDTQSGGLTLAGADSLTLVGADGLGHRRGRESVIGKSLGTSGILSNNVTTSLGGENWNDPSLNPDGIVDYALYSDSDSFDSYENNVYGTLSNTFQNPVTNSVLAKNMNNPSITSDTPNNSTTDNHTRPYVNSTNFNTPSDTANIIPRDTANNNIPRNTAKNNNIPRNTAKDNSIPCSTAKHSSNIDAVNGSLHTPNIQNLPNTNTRPFDSTDNTETNTGTGQSSTNNIQSQLKNDPYVTHNARTDSIESRLRTNTISRENSLNSSPKKTKSRKVSSERASNSRKNSLSEDEFSKSRSNSLESLFNSRKNSVSEEEKGRNLRKHSTGEEAALESEKNSIDPALETFTSQDQVNKTPKSNNNSQIPTQVDIIKTETIKKREIHRPIPKNIAPLVQQDLIDLNQEDEELGIINKIIFSLIDPISGSKIKLPVKSTICTHFECFDYETFCLFNKIPSSISAFIKKEMFGKNRLRLKKLKQADDLKKEEKISYKKKPVVTDYIEIIDKPKSVYNNDGYGCTGFNQNFNQNNNYNRGYQNYNSIKSKYVAPVPNYNCPVCDAKFFLSDLEIYDSFNYFLKATPNYSNRVELVDMDKYRIIEEHSRITEESVVLSDHESDEDIAINMVKIKPTINSDALSLASGSWDDPIEL